MDSKKRKKNQTLITSDDERSSSEDEKSPLKKNTDKPRKEKEIKTEKKKDCGCGK